MTRGAVDVAVDVPRLELDRPFTYLLPEGRDDATGHLVSVPFHGRTVKGWVLGPAFEVPGRVLPVRRVLSRVPLFGARELRLYRWMAERYAAPLATVIGRAHPPRVASEETVAAPLRPGSREPTAPSPSPLLSGYENAAALLEAGGGPAIIAVRPLPDEEASVCVEAVRSCVASGRDAVVIVPEAEPLPATARSVLEACGDAAVAFVGGDDRTRYRTWLAIRDGGYRVVVGTRPAVFAPVANLGLLWVSREAHPGHREERAPYYSVRDVAIARARLEGAACALSAFGPSAETAALVDDGVAIAVRAPRSAERAAAPLVETARPHAEDRSPRLTERLRSAGSAFLLASRRGYGVARVCKACGDPARCAKCGGSIVQRRGATLCSVCGGPAACANCGGTVFGVERGGTERLQEWASRLAGRSVDRVDERGEARAPGGRIVVGTAAAVKDFGPLRLDLVALIDPDRARRRPSLSAPEQALATWMEAAVWAGPRSGTGSVLAQTSEPGDPAIQSLVRWDPEPFHRAERRRRTEAGFPPGFPVFRVLGTDAVPEALSQLDPVTLLASGSGDGTVCLVTVRPADVATFRRRFVELATEGTLSRVEAEPHL